MLLRWHPPSHECTNAIHSRDACMWLLKYADRHRHTHGHRWRAARLFVLPALMPGVSLLSNIYQQRKLKPGLAHVNRISMLGFFFNFLRALNKEIYIKLNSRTCHTVTKKWNETYCKLYSVTLIYKSNFAVYWQKWVIGQTQTKTYNLICDLIFNA